MRKFGWLMLAVVLSMVVLGTFLLLQQEKTRFAATTAHTTTSAQVVAHPVTPPCHPTEVKATSKWTAPKQEVQKAHLSYPRCADNMRLVFPSEREVQHWYPKTYEDAGYDNEDKEDVEFGHAICVPDSLGGQ